MAKKFFGNLLSPIHPSVPGAVNPLAMIGAGMAQNNMLGALTGMGGLSQRGNALYLQQLQQQMAQRQFAQRQALAQAQFGLGQQKLAETERHNLAMETRPSSQMQLMELYRAASPEEREDIEALFGSGPTINVGGQGQFGGVPAGMQRVKAEGSPTGTKLVAEPGSEEDTKRREAVAGLTGVFDDISELERLVKAHGTESFGDVSREMDAIHSRIVGNLNLVRNTGVLNEGELARLERDLPSGTSIFQTGRQVLPSLSGYRLEVERKLRNLRQLYGLADDDKGKSGDGTEAGDILPNLPPGWTIREIK